MLIIMRSACSSLSCCDPARGRDGVDNVRPAGGDIIEGLGEPGKLLQEAATSAVAAKSASSGKARRITSSG